MGVETEVIVAMQHRNREAIHRLDGAIDGAERFAACLKQFVNGELMTRPKWMRDLPDDEADALVAMAEAQINRVLYARDKLLQVK